MIDKRLLNDSVMISKVVGKDDWGKETYSPPTQLTPVRFDKSSVINYSSRDETFSKPSVIYVYTRYCDIHLDDTWLKGKVEDETGDYIIQTINPIALFKRIVGYEIEVI